MVRPKIPKFGWAGQIVNCLPSTLLQISSEKRVEARNVYISLHTYKCVFLAKNVYNCIRSETTRRLETLWNFRFAFSVRSNEWFPSEAYQKPFLGFRLLVVDKNKSVTELPFRNLVCNLISLFNEQRYEITNQCPPLQGGPGGSRSPRPPCGRRPTPSQWARHLEIGSDSERLCIAKTS